jgi:hypothetical protein
VKYVGYASYTSPPPTSAEFPFRVLYLGKARAILTECGLQITADLLKVGIMASRQSRLCAFTGVVAVLLGFASVPAFSSGANAGVTAEQRCLANKLEAASQYSRCLIDEIRQAVLQGGPPSDERIARCDLRFDDAFARAEERAECHTAGGAEPVRADIREQTLATFTNVTETSPCSVVNIDLEHVDCLLSTSASSIDLEAMLDQVNTKLSTSSANPPTVDDDTVISIQAWGGHGGNGASLGIGSPGGDGGDYGYAQTTTTVGDIDLAFGVTQIYYYLGRQGRNAAESGGDGGTATFVATVDATTTADVLPYTLLIAGGGGGGGVGNGSGPGGFSCLDELGETGGAGGFAISFVGIEARASGTRGEHFPPSGSYGTDTGVGGTGGGGSSSSGGFKFAPIGGAGGGSDNTNPSLGFLNQSGVLVTAGGGHGGAPGDGPAPGGGGGGGYAGGGGGGEATADTNCYAGSGGGGSSLAIASTASCGLAPGSVPSNPNGNSGFVQIRLHLSGC